jgi:hypothetical protein
MSRIAFSSEAYRGTTINKVKETISNRYGQEKEEQEGNRGR